MTEETKSGDVSGELPQKGGSDIDSMIDSILMDPSKEDKPKEEPIETEAEAEAEVEVEEPEETEADDKDEVEEEEEDTAEAPVEAEETQESEDAPDETEVLFTTEDGSDVTLDELKRGYLRQSDYTKKTQDVAEGRKQVEAVADTLSSQQEVIAQNLELALNVIEPQLAAFATTNWEQLAANDAYEYAEKRALYDQAQVRYSQIQQAAQQTVAQAQAQRGYAQQQMLASERQKLQMALPDMADPKLGRKLAGDIREYSLSLGLSQDEASNITDHRLIVALNKARLYDELSTSKLTASRKKIKKGPKKVIRSGQPQTTTEKKATSTRKTRAKLRASGDIDDAVDWLLSG